MGLMHCSGDLIALIALNVVIPGFSLFVFVGRFVVLPFGCD